jgi:hypothetical protein
MKSTKLLMIVAIVLLIGFVVFMAFFMTSEGKKCVGNPFLYGANHMKNIDCSCVQFPDASREVPMGSCPAKFFFNDTNFWKVEKCY